MMMDLPFAAHLHASTNVCPTFSLYEPGGTSGTLETVLPVVASLKYLSCVTASRFSAFGFRQRSF